VNQLIWRLHRQQVLFATAALVVLAVVLAVTGTTMAVHYHSALRDCAATRSCTNLPDELFQGDGFIIDLVSATVIVPLLFGLFWGAPLVAKELEEGTQDLVWVQGVTRRRWMTSNVSWTLIAAVLWGAAMSALVSWWRGPEDILKGGRFGVSFDITGLVPVAYTVFAVALGIAAGTLIKRALPAMATTLAGFALARAVVGLWLRPRYFSPLRQLFPLVNGVSGAPSGAWVLSRVVVGPGGQIYDPLSPAGIPTACHAAFFNNSAVSCLAAHGFRRLVTYQPAGRYWGFQGIEAGIFLALAAGFVSIAYLAVSRRDA
jgi:hypothetical protein